MRNEWLTLKGRLSSLNSEQARIAHTELIKQLIHSEDAKSPLSDSQIAELLGEQGIMVARRTVAKYREGLRIPAVTQRKAL